MHPAYFKAMVRYLAMLAAVCAIASLYAGSGMFLVWLATAIAMHQFGRWTADRPAPRPSCSRKRRKRR